MGGSDDERTGPPCSEDLSSVSVQSISQPSSSESIQSAEEVSFLQETCDLCNVAEQSRNPQHRCRLCKNVVCNLFCSIQDPTSDNQMHRIHKPGHWICQQIQGGFDCPYCEKKVSSQRNLDDHISENHEHPSYSSFTLLSEGSLSDALFRCKNCNENFENEADLKDHMEKEDEEESFLENIFAQERISKKRKMIEESSVNKKAKLDNDLTCKICNQKLSRKDNLRRHMKSKHKQ